MSEASIALPPELAGDIETQMEALALETPPAVEADGAAPAETTEAAPEAEAAAPAKAEKPKAEAPPVEEPPKDGPGKTALALQKREQSVKARESAVKTQAADLSTKQAELDRVYGQVKSDFELAQKDPLEWLRKRHGLTDADIAHRLLNNGAARPEEQAGKASRETEELRRELNAMKQERAQERHTAARETALKAFVDASRGDAERWPLASKYSEARLREEGMAIAESGKAKGLRFSDADILDKIEERLSEIASLRGPAPAKPAAAKSPGAVVVKKGSRQVAAPTLAGASQDGAGGSDEDVDYLSLSEEDRQKLVMRALSRPGAAVRN